MWPFFDPEHRFNQKTIVFPELYYTIQHFDLLYKLKCFEGHQGLFMKTKGRKHD